jgi:hypothetical protein
MDPLIEAFGPWEDFHSKLIGEMERSLSKLVPDRYVVRTGERAYVAIGGTGADDSYEFPPDVALRSSPGSEAGGFALTATADAAGSDLAPVVMEALVKAEYRELFLKIHQTEPTRRLVTGIALLSPSNRCTVWPAHFLQPLPPIAVPLAPPDPDINLPIQPLADAV